ncbi:MAG TPA: sulfopyruvate decarboxylase subunit alpha, partial [Methanomicrobiales archaeon]|nr:sulfopyruvate decarboxylase subunit alpha [Methanomicrobiales archaeon]
MDEMEILREIKSAGIDLVTSVPCDRMKGLFFLLPEEFRHIGLTREEDGVGISAGAYLAGARPLVAIQSSGLGNMLNALLSLTVTFGLPLPVLASWRGGPDETIPAQVPFNRALPGILAAAGIPFTIISDPRKPEVIGRAITSAFTERKPHVILIPPRCIGEVAPVPEPPALMGSPRPLTVPYTREWSTPSMTRYDAIGSIANLVEDEVIVSNIGIPSKELYAAKDRGLNFYMLGSYTQASAIGLGIAAVRPDRRVIVLDGDGSLLGSSLLPVIAAAAPPGLTIVALDNGVFGSTGNQPRPGRDRADLRLMAAGAGIDHTWTVHDIAELGEA